MRESEKEKNMISDYRISSLGSSPGGGLGFSDAPSIVVRRSPCKVHTIRCGLDWLS